MPRVCYACKGKDPAFQFPENKYLLEQWVKVLDIECPKIVGKNGARICTDHFRESDIIKGKHRKFIKPSALPLHFKIDIFDSDNQSSEISKYQATKAASKLTIFLSK